MLTIRVFHFSVLAVLVLLLQAAPPETALDRYVKAPDPIFKFELVKTIPGDYHKIYVLNMISQQYLTTDEVNRPIWQHWVTIVKPDKVTTDIGLLFIGGGDNGNAIPDQVDPLALEIASATGAVVATLSNVPNQPLTFAGETRERSEDAIIAYTWDKFLQTQDAKWPLRLPMTKSAVRAMDAVSGFVASGAGGNVRIAKYVVCGESKRGWTTWTTAAVDKRVIAIIPEVIDVLNIGPSMRHHYRVYGSYSSELDDYAQLGIMRRANTLEYRNLMKIEEPFEYRERFTMPKFIINASGDQFFLPDSSQFYFDQLPGEKYLRYVPNANHGVRDNTDAGQSIAAYFWSIVKGTNDRNLAGAFRKTET